MTSKRLRRIANRVLACLLLSVAAGCNRGAEEPRTRSTQPHGPHGGHLAEMSENVGFQMEFTLDEKRRRMVIYVQESSTRKPHPLSAETLSAQFETNGQTTDLTFSADPRPDDPPRHASRFALSLDDLPQQLVASNQFVLKLLTPTGGRTITASIPHNNDHTHNYRHD